MWSYVGWVLLCGRCLAVACITAHIHGKTSQKNKLGECFLNGESWSSQRLWTGFLGGVRIFCTEPKEGFFPPYWHSQSANRKVHMSPILWSLMSCAKKLFWDHLPLSHFSHVLFLVCFSIRWKALLALISLSIHMCTSMVKVLGGRGERKISGNPETQQNMSILDCFPTCLSLVKITGGGGGVAAWWLNIFKTPNSRKKFG